jgi:hypothetical protein
MTGRLNLAPQLRLPRGESFFEAPEDNEIKADSLLTDGGTTDGQAAE